MQQSASSWPAPDETELSVFGLGYGKATAFMVQGQANLFEVSYHGSPNGHHDQVWTQLLTPLPDCRRHAIPQWTPPAAGSKRRRTRPSTHPESILDGFAQNRAATLAAATCARVCGTSHKQY